MAIVREIEVNYYEIPDSCYPVCLRWLNASGGWDSWVFVRENTLRPDYERGDVYNRPLEDYTVGNNLYAAQKHRKTPIVSVSAKGIELQEIEALEYLPASARVYEVVKDGSGGFDYVEVKVREAQAERNIEDVAGDIFITFSRPQRPFN